MVISPSFDSFSHSFVSFIRHLHCRIGIASLANCFAILIYAVTSLFMDVCLIIGSVLVTKLNCQIESINLYQTIIF